MQEKKLYINGVYLRMKANKDRLSKLFLLSAFVFVSVGTLYHNVFAVTAYVYNKLSFYGFENAERFSMDIFNTFIIVGIPAAVGYACMSIVFFISCVKGISIRNVACVSLIRLQLCLFA